MQIRCSRCIAVIDTFRDPDPFSYGIGRLCKKCVSELGFGKKDKDDKDFESDEKELSGDCSSK